MSVPEPRQRRLALVVVIVASLLWALSLIVALPMLMLSFMAFDAGETPQAWTIFALLWSYPLAVLVAIASSWIAFALRAFRTAMALSLLPLLSIAALAAFFLWHS
jgi:hypothetical protein